ncbi:Fe2+-dependent dioxygenase [Novosphingobium album (ex Hu et al. 2023)]|uniref:Fe2+-dependent dioxygenase n=1 Tax=Novosphingobium album (ex Hu et al. 2023) TaxID=2930093 RepID=A0ABT0AZV0_9SPHN|nr:Fe2+-dependent dioxygenase [Novosphingobium album (ex Hu et al. 2023)]MCJ2178300.1 Fe2+-dependent dioxygenase [Novosphingobium album (ex Hu et al. 2023)]
MLLHIPQVLTADEIAEFRRRLDGADWTDGRETVGHQGAKVKRNEQLPDTSPVKAELGRAVLAALKRSPLFFAAALPRKILPPRFNRYTGGGEYGFHIDGAVMSIGEDEHLRSDVSCTLFLNDPDEYDGGRLIISDTYGEHVVAKAAGDAIIYPSSSLHRVEPVTRGARIASFFWIQSLVRDDSQRRTLFELDTSIQKFTLDGADEDALLQLTCVYHNLLRRWSET